MVWYKPSVFHCQNDFLDTYYPILYLKIIFEDVNDTKHFIYVCILHFSPSSGSAIAIMFLSPNNQELTYLQ